LNQNLIADLSKSVSNLQNIGQQGVDITRKNVLKDEMKRFYICEKEWICDNGTKTVQNHPMQHKHKYMFNGTTI
jgi:hypothetical protein